MEATRYLKRTTWRAERLDEAAWCVVGALALAALVCVAVVYIIGVSPAVDAGMLAKAVGA
jgi:hypothetical protein